MPATAEVEIRGMRQLVNALARADRESQTVVRREFLHVAEPVRSDAEGYARERITRIGTKWPLMRVGMTRTSVYVAPKQRGVGRRGRQSRKRPNLGTLLMNRAMQPALDQNAATIEHAVERALDRIADHFNR